MGPRSPDDVPLYPTPTGVVSMELAEGISPTTITLKNGRVVVEGKAKSLDALRGFLERAKPTAIEPSFGALGSNPKPGPDAPDYGRYYTIRFAPDASTARLVVQLRALAAVKDAVEVSRMLPAAEPLLGVSDTIAIDPATDLQNQWYVHRCGAHQVWNHGFTGKGVVLAVIDFGFDLEHPELSNVEKTHNAFDGSANVSYGPHTSHGTAMAAIAAAPINQVGMAGIAHDVRPWFVQGDAGPGVPVSGNPWAQAIEWVRLAPADGRRKVVVLAVQTELGGNVEQIPEIAAAIKAAIKNDVVVVLSAGNGLADASLADDGKKKIVDTGAILVACTRYGSPLNRRMPWSNFGKRVDVSAPGDDAYDVTAQQETAFGYTNLFGGTSSAASKVAAIVALILQASPKAKPKSIRECLVKTGSLVTTAPDKPAGTFVNAPAALACVLRRGPRA